MILTEARQEHRTETMCKCGTIAKLRVGSHAFYIGHKKITVHNVPHFYCAHCNKAIFDSNTDMTSILRHAFLNNMDEVDWETRALYV
ncbi:YgiT-type zinc finger protein [Brevibacillus fluminis]|uniref:YgiT-type zinc finger protein n=1 Tax=Brevibacillus fluminis TaxID=511487 RepID=UPI003F8B01D6